MVRSYKLIITLCITLAAAGMAHAQSFGGLRNATPEKRASFQTGMMKRKLNLDTAQTRKVQVINLKYALKFDPLLKAKGNNNERLKQAMAMQATKDEELKAVFTREQFKTYQALEEDLKKRIMKRLE